MCEAMRDLMKEDFERAEARGISIGEARGISIGEARGISIGEIRGAIKTYARMGKQPSEITKLIEVDFGLKQEIAEKYVEETLNLQLA